MYIRKLSITISHYNSELQIRRGNKDNSEIIFISLDENIVRLLIRTVSVKGDKIMKGHNMFFFMEK